MSKAGRSFLRLALLETATILALAACGPSPSPRQEAPQAGTSASTSQSPRGTLKIAWSTEPESLSPKLAAGAALNEYHWVFNSFLTYFDFQGRLHPMLAREIPSQQNGDWVLNPDGSMITIYRLRENARWHDGAPITASDYAFAFEVYVDPDIPVRDRVPETLIARVDARDDFTLAITWREPYVGANSLTFQQLSPLPKHLYEEKYRANKANFVFGEEWTTGYVGTGPFRIDRWTPGSSLVARANTSWVLGPPKIDTVEIRFIPDAQTLLANVLAGEVDLIDSPGVDPPEAAIARDRWAAGGEGYVRTWQRQMRFLAFQFREVPNWQSAIADTRVRQALMYATDRQSLADVISHGLGTLAHAFMIPNDALFPDVERSIVTYAYDPGRAAALLNDAGWKRADSSAPFVNTAGQTLDIELWSTTDSSSVQESAVLVSNWKANGFNSSVFLIPAARQRDFELRVSFPSVNITTRSATLDNFVFLSTHLPTPETRYQGANRGSFHEPEIDRLHNLALTSLDPAGRRQAVIDLHRLMSERLGIGPLYFGGEVLIARSRLKGPVGEVAEKSGMSWNIFEWEVTD
jgi:peptide/nickel transport system substrate-binding protein